MGLEVAGAAETAVATAGRRHHRAARVGAGAVARVFGLGVAAEDVELVDDVEHRIGVERVAPRVGAHHGVDRAGDVALLREDVVEAEAEREGAVAEEGLRELGVPEQFVGVHRRGRETAARLHADVGGEAQTERQVEVGRGPIGEAPRVEIGARLEGGARVLIVHTAVEGHVPERTAVGQVDVFAQGEDAADTLFGRHGGEERVELFEGGNAAEGCGRRGGDEAHAAGEGRVGRGGEGEDLLLVERCVEGQAGGRIPVAREVFGSGEASAGGDIVDHERGDGVACVIEVGVGHRALLPLGVVGVVESVEHVVPRGFKAGIAAGDVERVGTVDHVEQLCHGGLRRTAAIEDVEAVGLGDVVAEAHLRGEVEDVAHGVHPAHDGALVVQAGAFRRETDAGAQVDFLRVEAQSQLGVVGVVVVGGIL